MEMLSRGRHVAPRLAFSDVSSFNGGMPNASVTRLKLLLVSTCCGSRAPATVTNCVLTLLNHTWWSERARKPLLRAPRRARDRKSTRLNSSHGYISYAVFCLKKKTPPHQLFEHQLPVRGSASRA